MWPERVGNQRPTEVDRQTNTDHHHLRLRAPYAEISSLAAKLCVCSLPVFHSLSLSVFTRIVAAVLFTFSLTCISNCVEIKKKKKKTHIFRSNY